MNLTRATLTTIAGLAVFGLSACSSTEPAPSPTDKAPTAEPAPVGPSGDELVSAVESELGPDIEHVESIDSPEAGRVQITTNLTDPGSATAAESLQALAMCEAAARVDGVTYVNVTEADGTSWVLYGHPSMPEGDCAVV